MSLPDIKNIFDVSGKVALITGATGGFGHAASLGMAAAATAVLGRPRQ